MPDRDGDPGPAMHPFTLFTNTVSAVPLPSAGDAPVAVAKAAQSTEAEARMSAGGVTITGSPRALAELGARLAELEAG